MASLLRHLLVALILVLPFKAVAQSHDHSSTSTPYAGFEKREIKSLSNEDIAELRRGGGWGLALPAELNGRPGPAHVLELQDELQLSEAQKKAISALYADMRATAIIAGERFIAAEAALSMAFSDPRLEEEALKALIDEAAEARAALRYVHLSQHLATPQILSGQQVERYNVLRGYAEDPCANAPEGHNESMWRKHNGCS